MTEPMHDAAGQPEQGVSQPSPGAQLAARRQQFGWTVEQVASQINLAPRQIEAIEADNYAALPGMAVARGFLRAYAKLLKIDAAPLLAQVGSAPSAAEHAIPLRRTIAATSFTPHRPATRARRGGPGKLIAGVVVIAVLGVGAYAAVRNGLGGALTQKLALHLPGSAKGAAGGADTAGAAASSSSSVVETPATPAAGDATGAAASSTVAPGVAAPQPPLVSTAPAAAAAPAATALTPSPSLGQAPAAAEKALVLKLREDSWVEIRRADNSTVVSRVMRAGSTETFDLAGPITLIVGNVRGVDATYHGAPVSLKSGTKNNVARVRVQ